MDISKWSLNLVTDCNTLAILEDLKKREPIFHHPEFGTTEQDFVNMTDQNFWEVGASGRRYSREEIINTLIERYKDPNYVDIWATQDFHCLEIARDNFLLTYSHSKNKQPVI